MLKVNFENIFVENCEILQASLPVSDHVVQQDIDENKQILQLEEK